MEQLYKLEPGVVFTIDAKMWDKQYEKLDFPIDYVEINDGKIVLKLETVEKIKTKRHWWQFWRLKKKCYRFRVIAVALLHKKFIKLFFQNLLTIKGFCVIIDTSKPQGKFKEIDYGIRNYCFALGVRYYGRNVPV